MAQLLQIKMLNQNKVVELRNNFIQKATIKAAFLLADDALVSLFYPRDEIQISCEMNEAGTIFFLPNGWPSMEFTVESNYVPSRPSTPADMEAQIPISSRPGTLMEEALNESPYHPELPNALSPSAKCFNKWMFYLMEQTKSTAICMHPRFFVTFRHGTHRRFKIGDNLKLYHAQKEVDEQTGVDVCVAKIDESYDFILLKSESDVIDRGPRITHAEESEPFTLAGFGDGLGCIAYLPGSIYSIRRHYFCGQGPFMLGTSRSSCGDSGGGIWGSRGLIGMNFGCTAMPLHNHQEAISQAAIFSPKNIISPAVEFEKAYMRELEKERKEQESPTVKKSCLVTVVDGRTLFGSVVL